MLARSVSTASSAHPSDSYVHHISHGVGVPVGRGAIGLQGLVGSPPENGAKDVPLSSRVLLIASFYEAQPWTLLQTYIFFIIKKVHFFSN